MKPIALKLKKVNENSVNFEVTQGEPILVFIQDDDNSDLRPETNQQTGTSYTLQLTDEDKIVQTTNGSTVTITVPPNSTTPFPIGSIVGLEQYGAGVLTVAGGAGVMVRSLGNSLVLAGQYADGALRKLAANEWILTGALG